MNLRPGPRPRGPSGGAYSPLSNLPFTEQFFSSPLSHPGAHRLALVIQSNEGMNFSDIRKKSRLSQNMLARYLLALEAAKIVRSERDHLHRYIHLCPGVTIPAEPLALPPCPTPEPPHSAPAKPAYREGQIVLATTPVGSITHKVRLRAPENAITPSKLWHGDALFGTTSRRNVWRILGAGREGPMCGLCGALEG